MKQLFQMDEFRPICRSSWHSHNYRLMETLPFFNNKKGVLHAPEGVPQTWLQAFQQIFESDIIRMLSQAPKLLDNETN